MKHTLRFFFTITLFFSFCLVQAQQTNQVIGKVVDEMGNPLPGVNVQVKGKKVGTVTNIDGNYVVNVFNPTTDILIFSFIGLEPKEETITNRKVINVNLANSSVQLNEVVAIGYGNMSRKDLTGSVVSVDTQEMSKTSSSDVGQALAGRVSGVMVSQSEGAPGSSISIKVRGGMSLTGSNDPLYIIDGFPSESGLSNIDPRSIQSMDVLKDASSTAIYGARGANGVVVITTKSGTSNKTTISYDGFYGIKKLSKELSVLNPYEFVLQDYERRNLANVADMATFNTNYGPFSDISQYNQRPGVNWQDLSFGQTAITQSHRVSISGGANKLKYNLSYSRADEQGQMVLSGLKKDNFRIKLDHEISDRFSASIVANYTQSNVYGRGTSSSTTYFNPMTQILQYRPTMGILGSNSLLITQNVDPIFDTDGANVMVNPVVSAQAEHRVVENRNLQINGGFNYKLLKGLSFKNTIGISYNTGRTEIFYGAASATAKRTSIQGSIGNSDWQTSQISNTLNYEGSIGKHKFNALIGQEYVTTWTRSVTASAFGFPNDDIGLNNLSMGSLPGTPTSNFNDDNKLMSFFARIYYNYANKYMLTATLRADGSSKFAQKWGEFPSASFAWRASEETFIKKLNIFSDLKLRIGYGQAGNNRIGSYGSLSIMAPVTAPFGISTATGFATTQIPNGSLMWEANTTMNMGLDLGFFGQRLIITPEFYINQSSKLLLQANLPPSCGFTSMIQNIGQTENRGFDLSFRTVNIKKGKFEWDTNLNISRNENKVVSLAGEQSFLVESGWGNGQSDFQVKVGDPIGQIYGYKVIGLYQVSDFDYNTTTQKYTLKPGVPYDSRNLPQPGYWKYQDNVKTLDASGNPLITDADRMVIGNTTPLFYGGLNNTFTYANLDLSIFLNFSYGNDVLNATKLYATKVGSSKNMLDVMNSKNRWMTIDASGARVTDPTALGTLNEGKTLAQYGDMTAANTYITSWIVEDGSFIRINNITMGYTFPKSLMSKVGISKFRIYATASNLYTFTKYSGFDPEVSTRNSTGFTPGVDWGAYPRSVTLTVGLNLTL